MILDTNVYSGLVLQNAAAVQAIASATQFLMPLPVLAELRSGFLQGSRPDHNEAMLQNFLSRSDVDILTPSIQTTHLYARLQTFCKRKGRALSNNDVWIAALAQQEGDRLITFDNNFQIFAELLGENVLILS